jgi:hypothetical protein
LGGSLAPGATIASGLTSGSLQSRVANGYLNPAAFTPASLLYYPNISASQCSAPTGPDPSGNTCVTGFGNLGRNIYRGPHEQNWDASLIKLFKLGERKEVRFTADFFNLWNHANFANPAFTDVEVGSAFGKIFNSTGTPRLIQFSLRWAF